MRETPSGKMLFTTEEAAKALSISPGMIRKLVREGRMGSVKVGNLRRFRQQDLDEVCREGCR